jgi:hypothetical protein
VLFGTALNEIVPRMFLSWKLPRTLFSSPTSRKLEAFLSFVVPTLRFPRRILEVDGTDIASKTLETCHQVRAFKEEHFGKSPIIRSSAGFTFLKAKWNGYINVRSTEKSMLDLGRYC